MEIDADIIFFCVYTFLCYRLYPQQTLYELVENLKI